MIEVSIWDTDSHKSHNSSESHYRNRIVLYVFVMFYVQYIQIQFCNPNYHMASRLGVIHVYESMNH